MKFIIDAQLPKALCTLLELKGYDCIHTSEMANKNKSTDEEINQLSIKEQRIVISKDIDFYNRHLLKAEPYKLIFLTTGNISNEKLMDIVKRNLEKILEEIHFNQIVEITRTSIITIV